MWNFSFDMVSRESSMPKSIWSEWILATFKLYIIAVFIEEKPQNVCGIDLETILRSMRYLFYAVIIQIYRVMKAIRAP